jgi:hypothetical protein
MPIGLLFAFVYSVISSSAAQAEACGTFRAKIRHLSKVSLHASGGTSNSIRAVRELIS